jgi:hypothetical protein
VTKTFHPDGTVTFWCSFCGGCAHPARWTEYSWRCVACLRCSLEARRWFYGWVNRKAKKGKPNFYDHVPAPASAAP